MGSLTRGYFKAWLDISLVIVWMESGYVGGWRMRHAVRIYDGMCNAAIKSI